jgi:hypothetical protein
LIWASELGDHSRQNDHQIFWYQLRNALPGDIRYPRQYRFAELFPDSILGIRRGCKIYPQIINKRKEYSFMQQDKEERKPQVSKQLDRLTNELNILEKNIDKLKERLQPILRSISTDSVAVPKAEEDLVELADRLKDNVYKTADMNSSVGFLLELLEL